MSQRSWPIGLLFGLWILTAAPAIAQDTAGTGGIRGTANDDAGRPVSDVAICVSGTGQCDVTPASGRFAIEGLRAGTYQLEILAPGRPRLLSQPLDVRAGLETTVEIAVPAPQALLETVTVTPPAFAVPEEIRNSGFLVSAADVLQGAGSLQDVSRYVQSLPGVVIGTNDFRNDLIVRGGSPLENLYIVDNVEIPNLNSFATFASAGGTVGMLDSALLRDVTFLSGGFPAAYGNRASSVLQITQREGNRTKVEGRGTVGFAGAAGIFEGPFGRNGAGSWIVSVRRSFLDLFTKDVGIGGVPVAYTVNGKIVFDASPRDRLWVVNITGLDNIRLGLTETTDPTSELSNLDIRYTGSRSATGFSWQRLLGTRGVGLFGVSFARAGVSQSIKDLIRGGVPPAGTPAAAQIAAGTEVFREQSAESELTVKYDLTLETRVAGKVQAGVSIRQFLDRYDAASPFGSDSPYFPLADANPFSIDDQLASTLVGAYAQATRALTTRLNATAGVRVDRYQYASLTRLSPRASLDYRISPRLSLNGSYGRYVQQPFILFLAAYPENRSLVPFQADHYVAGLAYAIDASTRFTIESYRKSYDHYPVSSQIPSLSLANAGDTFAIRDVLFPMTGNGLGVAQGVELFAERKAGAGRWHGQANLTVSRARYAGLDGVLRPGTFDAPVAANLVAGYQISPAWDLSARIAYQAGRPFTPFDAAASAQQRRGVYDLAQVNADRLPSYFRADLRIDRRLTVRGRAVTIFGGVQNLTNRRNVSGYTWDRRAGRVRVNEQLGVFPLIGLDWSF